jgi:hypothetical protein
MDATTAVICSKNREAIKRGERGEERERERYSQCDLILEYL